MAQNKNLLSILSCTKDELKAGMDKRLERVSYILSLPKGPDQDNRIYHDLWSDDIYRVTLGKPGKEAREDYQMCRYKDGHRGNNPNDSKPTIFKNGVVMKDAIASFEQVFDSLVSIKNYDKALELTACLLFRSAFMVDHFLTKDKSWVYRPPSSVLDAVSEESEAVGGLPYKVYLHFLDAIGLNEDVKYHTLGFDVRLGYGRRNNMMTCVSLIAVLLNKYSISDFAGSFSRPPVGISALSIKKSYEFFKYLRPI